MPEVRSPAPLGGGSHRVPRKSRRRVWAARAWAPVALAVVPAALIVLLPGHSSGQSLDSINSRINSTRGKLSHVRGREHVLTSDIAALSGRIHSLEGEIVALQGRESRAASRLAVKQAQLDRIRARYELEQARFLRLLAKLKRAQGVLATRLVEIYKSDQPDYLTVVLEADGFQDLLVRADYLSRIGDQDSAIVDRVRELKQESARKRRLLAALKQQAQATVNAIAAQKRELASARGALQDHQGQLAGARNQKQGALGNVRESRRHLEGDLAALEAASARVTAQLRGAGGPLQAGPVKQGSGSFIWPVNGPVVSPFGMRWGRLHAGVDIAVPSGTPIRAAGSGRVAIAGWEGGYGNYTCIEHGGGIATCYGHQASIGVSVGQSVSKGQVIGISDCTGHCFGPHVHFEVRINGTPVDPMGYL
jgi:murein DD-endopeptidase MepM/ murein hydrolase activator NlpD